MLCRQGLPSSIDPVLGCADAKPVKRGGIGNVAIQSGQESCHGIARETTRRLMLTGWIHAMGIWLRPWRLRQDLSDLDDRLLDDVGISREDALWKAGKSLWGP
jgi:uncharacterized protein YjiS (DUF1127 family)